MQTYMLLLIITGRSIKTHSAKNTQTIMTNSLVTSGSRGVAGVFMSNDATSSFVLLDVEEDEDDDDDDDDDDDEMSNDSSESEE